MDIKQIVKGTFNNVFDLNKEMYEERIRICKSCPLYSLRLGGICNSKLWLDPLTGDVSTKKKAGYYKGCNCRLDAKTRVSEAKCPAGKW